MKFKAAIDTSALISLNLSGLFEKSLKYFSFLIGNVIHQELEDIGKTGNTIGNAANDILKHVNAGVVALIEIPKKEKGEMEALEIMRKFNCDYLISDDIKFVMKTQRENENIHFSVAWRKKPTGLSQ